MRDIYHSARGKYKLCEYFIRNEDEAVGDLSVYVLKNRASGIFYAIEVNNKALNRGEINNVFSYDENYITIETNDNVEGLKNGCVVKYNGHAWNVLNVQQTLHHKEAEFGNTEYSTLIALKR